MALALIGMSGVGKTFWANRLAAAGFSCLHCDDLIAEKLRANGDVVNGSVEDVGAWMGYPFSAGYPQREARYLAYEAEVLRDIAASLTHEPMARRQLVIDMTGSVVYCDRAILDAIRSVVTMVYLRATPAQHKHMLKAYRATPRPIIWNGLYDPYPNEEPAVALARCYPRLIQFRADLYERFSHVVLDPAIYQNPAATTADFLRAVEHAMR